jgi:glyoxylase-like metal-dependent hydrolase (beta-lactamase superfamily II)
VREPDCTDHPGAQHFHADHVGLLLDIDRAHIDNAASPEHAHRRGSDAVLGAPVSAMMRSPIRRATMSGDTF